MSMQKKRKTIIALITFIIITGITGITVSYLLIHKSTPRKTIETFEKSIKHNDINNMIGCLTPDNQEYANTLIQSVDDKLDKPISLLIDVVPLLSNFLDISILSDIDIVIIEEHIEKDTAIVSVNLEIPKKISINADVNMVKIKNKWYIKSMKPNLF